MKKWFVLVWGVLILILMPAPVVEAEEMTATYAITAPIIDGEIDEVWENAEKWYVVTGPEDGTTTGYFSVLWAEKGLFILVNIEDTTLFPGDEVDDGGLIYIAENPTTAETYSNISEYWVTGYTNGWFGGIATDDSSIHKARKLLSDTNYVIEFFVPTQTKKLNYSNGHIIGISMAIFDDLDGDNVKDNIYGTTEGNFRENPSLLQRVRLEKPEGAGVTVVPTDIERNYKIAVGILVIVMLIAVYIAGKAKKKDKDTNIIRIIYMAVLGVVSLFGIIKGSNGSSECLKYFTYLSNGLVVVMAIWQIILCVKKIFAKDDEKKAMRIPPAVKGWIVMCIVFAFLTYFCVLNAFKLPNNIQDAIVHYIVPFMTLVEFLVFEERGIFKKYYPLCWSVTPIAYYVYVLSLRMLGITFEEGQFPYFFMDHITYGWGMVLGVLCVLYAIFIIFGYLLYLVDIFPFLKKLRCK